MSMEGGWDLDDIPGIGEEWEPTTVTFEKGPGVSHRMIFTTRTAHGSYTEIVRLTKSELRNTWFEMARFITSELD
jgi:hypothetical protein